MAQGRQIQLLTLTCVRSNHTLRVGLIVELRTTGQGGSDPRVARRRVDSVKLMVGNRHWSIRVELELWRMAVEGHLALKVGISQTGDCTVFVELSELSTVI